MNNMQQGLVIVDKDENVLLCNEVALNLFQCSKENIIEQIYINWERAI